MNKPIVSYTPLIILSLLRYICYTLQVPGILWLGMMIKRTNYPVLPTVVPVI